MSASGASDWAEVVDKKSGRKYYYNKKTRETSWHAPMSNAQSPSNSSATPAPAAAASPAPSKPTHTPQLPPDWFETRDPKTGTKYYYNKKTRETSWTVPKSKEMTITISSPNPSREGPSPRTAPKSPYQSNSFRGQNTYDNIDGDGENKGEGDFSMTG